MFLMYSLDIYGTFYFAKVTLAVQYNAKALGSQRDLTVHLYSHNDNNEKQAAVYMKNKEFCNRWCSFYRATVSI